MRKGFTIIELLIVMAIIAILVALALPAVQQAREIANMTTCRNNLRQMGLAAHHYESRSRRFPTAGEYLVNGKVAHNIHSVHTLILPFIERENIAKSYNKGFYYNAPVNQFASKQVVPLFICPTNPLRELSHDSQGYGCTDYTTASYFSGIDANGNKYKLPGGLAGQKGVSVGMIADGLSNTIMFYEDVGRHEGFAHSRYSDPYDGQPRRFWRWAEPDNAAGVSRKVNNNRWPFGGPPNCRWLTQHDCGPNNEFFSFHFGGAHACMMDGSVRFVSDEISLYTLRSIVSRTGGEVVPEF